MLGGNHKGIFRRPAKDVAAGIFLAALTCVLIISAIRTWEHYRTNPPYVDEEKYPVRGIDISRHNGEVDFRKVKESGIEFVFIKASEGATHRDSLFVKNLEKAGEAGLKTGAYHFFRYDTGGVDQAVNFLQAVGSRHLDMGLVIDVEDTGNPSDVSPEDVKRRLESMVEYMNMLGYRVMIYTNLDGYYNYISDTLPGYPLWICRFKENPINAEWTFWQYDHHGRVEGVKGDVDMNAFYGNREEWKRFLEGDIYSLQY